MLRYTYADAYERMQKLGGGLGDIGVKIGDRVGVLAWNSHENFEIYFGLPATGAVMVLLNLRLAPQDLSYVINHSGISHIIVDETLLPIAEGIAPLCENVKSWTIITMPGKKLADVKTKLEPTYSYEDLIANGSPVSDWPNMNERSAYAACYTTGTTGKPKGVYYSHRDVYLHTTAIGMNTNISPEDTYCQVVPMFHALGWGLAQAAAMVGCRLVFPGMYTLDTLDSLSKLLVEEKILPGPGCFPGPPSRRWP